MILFYIPHKTKYPEPTADIFLSSSQHGSPDAIKHNRKKKTRRSKLKKPREITIYYCNINGLKTKQESIKQVVEQLAPKIILLCETKLPSVTMLKKNFPGYEVNGRPMKKGQSGLATMVKSQTFNSVLDVTSTGHKNILVTRVGLDTITIRIILGYAPQENENAEEREQFFTELEIEIAECELAGDFPMLVGDMNSKIELEQEEQIEAVSRNGRLLTSLIKERELHVLNFDRRCIGKWTHVVRTTGSSSVLDYMMVSNELSKLLKVVTVDEECLFCPFWLKKKKGKQTPQYSDHNAIIATFEIPHSKPRPQKQKGWKITEDGLVNFKAVTSSDDFPSGVETENISGKHVYDTYEKIMDLCFRKNRPAKEKIFQNSQSALYRKVMQYAKQGKAQRKVAKTYIIAIRKANIEKVSIRNKEAISTTLKNLTIDNSFSPNNFWQLCKKNRKSTNTMGTSVITEAGNEVFGEDLIKDTYMKEFTHRLRQRQISPELKNYEKRTRLLCQLYIEQAKSNMSPEYSVEELDNVVKNLKRKKSPGRDSLPPEIPLNWGGKLKNLTLAVMNNIKNSHEIPVQWLNVLISTIYKNKGNKKILVNQRGIFLKQILSKMFERINMNRIEENVKRIDPTQAGSRNNRSPADQTFLLRSCTDHAKYLNRPVYIVLYDYSQCFDSLWLDDCLLSLWKLGVNNDVLSLIREMNKESNIVVKTPFGPTEQFTVHNIVQQGSVCGGVLCSASTGEVLAEIPMGGTEVGNSVIKVLVYVDDIATINSLINDVYDSHRRVIWFSKKKRLTINGKKCIILCVNLKPSDVTPSLTIDNTPVPNMDVAEYLGDHFNNKGTNKNLVEERTKKGKACIVSSMALCSDTTMGIHAVETLLLLYRSLFLPVVLYNAQSWSNITKTETQALQTIQLKYIKRTLHAPASTSNPLTYLETGILPLKYEIHIKQLTFLHHIITLDKNDIVHKTYNQQLRYAAPNWANEVLEIRKLYGLTYSDTEIGKLSKDAWKRDVKKKVREKALASLNAEAQNQKTGQKLPVYKELAAQDYLTTLLPSHARKIFHVRTGTIDLRGNREYKYGEETSCKLCHGEVETVQHILNECPTTQYTKVIDNIYTTDCSVLKEMAERCMTFDAKVDDAQGTDAADL